MNVFNNLNQLFSISPLEKTTKSPEKLSEMNRQDQKKAIFKKFYQAKLRTDMKVAKETVNEILKRYTPLSCQETLKILSHFQISGEYHRAIKLLPPEMSPIELKLASRDDIILQYRLCYLFHVLGARNTSYRMLKNLETELSNRDQSFAHFYVSAIFYVLVMKYRDGRHKEVVGYRDLVNELYQPSHKDWPNVNIWIANSLHNLGETKEALKIAEGVVEDWRKFNPKSPSLIMTAFRAIGELKIELRDSSAIESLWEGLDIIAVKNGRINLEFQRCLGLYYAWKGKIKEAMNHFHEGLSIGILTQGQPAATLSNLFWLYYYGAPEPFPGAYRVLKTHQVFNNYSRLLGHKYIDADEFSYARWGERYLDKYEEGNCWYIQKNNIKTKDYKKLVRELSNKDENFLDLRSGILFKKDQPPKVLSQLQADCLAQIISCDPMGLLQWTIVDILYKNDFINGLHALDRLKNLFNTLRKMGFQIETEKGYVFLKNIDSFNIILPNPIKSHGVIEFLSAFDSGITINQIVNHFKVDRSTVNRWIKEWQQLGKVEKIKEGRRTLHHFKAS